MDKPLTRDEIWMLSNNLHCPICGWQIVPSQAYEHFNTTHPDEDWILFDLWQFVKTLKLKRLKKEQNVEAGEVKLRVRSNDGTTMVLEQLNGEDALEYIAETPEELEKLPFFTVGAEIDCGLQIDLENPLNTRVYLHFGDTVVSNFEIPE